MVENLNAVNFVFSGHGIVLDKNGNNNYIDSVRLHEVSNCYRQIHSRMCIIYLRLSTVGVRTSDSCQMQMNESMAA